MLPEEVSRQRIRQYNAQVLQVTDVHSDLRIFRIRTHGELSSFAAGQYLTLGLGLWEPRIAGLPEEKLDTSPERLIKRAYSISCSMLNDSGQLVRVTDCQYLEFYIALVRRTDHVPSLTPRLFALHPGAGIFVGSKIVGRYTLAGVQPTNHVVFFATGTGEAPHNAMVAELLARRHAGRIISVTCVRRRQDLAYLSTHRELERRFANYRYVPLTTREPENLDPNVKGFVGKRYLQEYVASGAFEREANFVLDPQATRIYLCGNPAMIGYRASPATSRDVPDSPSGMVAILARRGFQPDELDRPGTISLEKYW